MKNLEELNKLVKQKYETCVYGRLFSTKKCSKEIIKAHSIPRAKILERFSPENKHVYSVVDAVNIFELFRNNGKFRNAKKIGISKASVFKGLCKHHDQLLFPVSDQLNLQEFESESKKQALKEYALRTLLRETYAKISTIKQIINLTSKGIIRTNPVIEPFISGVITGNISGIRDLEREIRTAIEAIQSRKKYYHVVEIKLLKYLPIIWNTTFSPLYNPFSLKQRTFDPKGNEWPKVYFIGLSDKVEGLTRIFLFTLKKDKSFIEKFFLPFKEELKKSTNNPDFLINFLTKYAILYGDNIYFHPDYWENLENVKKTTIFSLFERGAQPWKFYDKDFFRGIQLCKDATNKILTLEKPTKLYLTEYFA